MKENERQPLSATDLWQIHWASGANILFGAWLFVAPWLLAYAQDIIRWNDTITGVVLVVLATLRFIHPIGRFWISWFNACIGLWMIAAPFVLHCQHPTAQVNDITLGMAIFVVGAVSGSVRAFHR
jgi:hypothetical protein